MPTIRKTVDLLLEFSIPLIAGVVVALAWANIDATSYGELVHWSPFGHDSHLNLHFLFNDIFMVFFFGIAAKEITESCLPGGALNPPRRAVNPLLGTIGGVLGPVGVYFLWGALTDDPSIYTGWGIPTATDIALAWLVARLIFGARHPAVSFLLLLAVADDGIGLGIIAVFYPDPHNPVEPLWLLLVLAAFGAAIAMRRNGVRNFWVYLLGPGVLSWAGLYLAHLHPALALVPVVPLMPSLGRDLGLFAASDHQLTDTLTRFEHALSTPVDVGLFGFGLVNAGVGFSSMGNATAAVLVSLVVGKTVGIFLLSAIGHAFGFTLPDGMSHRSLLIAGMVAGLGLTVALFVAGVAFTDPDLQGAAKMGALLSVAIIPVAFVLGKLLRVRQVDPEPDNASDDRHGELVTN